MGDADRKALIEQKKWKLDTSMRNSQKRLILQWRVPAPRSSKCPLVAPLTRLL